MAAKLEGLLRLRNRALQTFRTEWNKEKTSHQNSRLDAVLAELVGVGEAVFKQLKREVAHGRITAAEASEVMKPFNDAMVKAAQDRGWFNRLRP